MKTTFITLLTICISVVSTFAQPVFFNWARSFGGNGSGDTKLEMSKDAAGNVYITGDFTGTRTFGTVSLTASGFSDVFVVKFNTIGTVQWAIKAGASFSSAFAGGVAVNGSEVYVTGRFSNIIACGTASQSSFGQYDAFVMKLNASTGSCDWIEKAGGVNEEASNSITIANNGGAIICGTFSGTASFGTINLNSGNPSNQDIFIAKYNADGTCAWANKAGGNGSDIAWVVKQAPNNDIFVTGNYSASALFGSSTIINSTGNDDFFLAKYTQNGLLSWVQSGGGKGNEFGKGLGVDNLSDAYVSGFISDTSTFGSFTIYDNTAGNAFIGKYSNSGVPQWFYSAGSFFFEIANGMSTDLLGNTYVTGYMTASSNFGPVNITGTNDAFVVKYTHQGTARWGTSIGGANYAKGESVLADVNGLCYAAGYFFGTISAGSLQLTSPPNEFGAYLVKMGGGTVGISENTDEYFTSYPNPANDVINLDLKKITDRFFTIEIFHIDGKMVSSQIVTRQQTLAPYQLDVSQLASGNYVLKLSSSQGEFSKSVLIDRR